MKTPTFLLMAFGSALFVITSSGCGSLSCDRPTEDPPDCCPATVSGIPMPDSLRDVKVGADSLGAAWSTARICPCDSSIIEIHNYLEYIPEEDPAAAHASSKPETNTLLRLPELEIFDSSYVARRILPQPGTEPVLKVAILDTGLADSLWLAHKNQIKVRKNMFDFNTDEIPDARGHGSVVFSIIYNQTTPGTVEYYIYKCINDEGIASTFTVACALKCAMMEKVDIINASLGTYDNDPLLKEIIENELKVPALIVSQGNDCARADVYPHYPSDYTQAYGIIGISADCAEPPKSGDLLWGCSNGAPAMINIGAPCVVTSSSGEDDVSGTSFAAAYTSGSFADYLFSHYSPKPGTNRLDYLGSTPHKIFRDEFRWDPAEVDLLAKYLYAAENCVVYSSLK